MAETIADERECRICRGEAEPGRPLLHPCRCSGSIKYTHEDCLVNWLSQSGSTRCELCNHPFRFEPLYQPNTPSALPTAEFLVGILALARNALRTTARILLVFTVWLFFLPVGTCWTWYALFINSPAHLPALLASRGPAGIVADAFYGFLLSATIVFVFLGVSSLREYVRHLPLDGAPADFPQHAAQLDEDPLQPVPPLEQPLLQQPFQHPNQLPYDQNQFEFDPNPAPAPTPEFPADHYQQPPYEQQRQHLHGQNEENLFPPIEHAQQQILQAQQFNSLHDTLHPPNLALYQHQPHHLADTQHDSDSVDDQLDDVVVDEVDELVRDTLDVIVGDGPASDEDDEHDQSSSEEGDDDDDENQIHLNAQLAPDSGDDSDAEVAMREVPNNYSNNIIHNRTQHDINADNNTRTRAFVLEDEHGFPLMAHHREQHGMINLHATAAGLQDSDSDSDWESYQSRQREIMQQHNRQDHAGMAEGPNNRHMHEVRHIDEVDDGDNVIVDDDDLPEDDDVIIIHEDDDDDLVNHEDPDGRVDGGALFGLFELDPDEVPLEEVVGLRGPIRNLFDNAGTVLVSNAIFLGVFTLIPLLIGRLTLRLFSMHAFPLLELQQSGLPVLPSLSSAFHVMSSSITPDPIGTLNRNLSTGLSASATGVTGNNLIDKAARTANASYTAAGGLARSSSSSLDVELPVVTYVDNFLIVLLGYGMIALGAVAYIGVMSALRQRYPRLDSPITRQVARVLRYIATFVKIIVLIVFEFGIFPLGCGWWLDICTLELLGGTVQSRLSFCRDSPWSCMGGHWIMGIMYMVHISLFISLLREILRPELLRFLRNPDDPDFHPFRELVEKPLSKHARRLCISVVIYVPLIVALVYVPGQVCLKVLPDVFPFRSEDFSHILIDVPFGNLLVGPLIRLLYFGRPEISLHKVLAMWIGAVSSILGIRDLVVKKEEDENDIILNNLDEDEDGDEDVDGNEHSEIVNNDGNHVRGLSRDDGRKLLRVRGGVMMVCAWLTLVVVESALISTPTMLGRWVMGAVGLPVRHDLHPFLLGLNIVLGCVSGVVKVVQYMRTLDTMTMVSMGVPYVVMGMKGGVMVTLWLGAIPLAAGLLFELMLVPMRVAHDETPYFCLQQDWALGLLLLKVWSCVAATGGLGAKWRERVLRAREGEVVGLEHNFERSMREVVLPVLVAVVTALAVPYSVARSMLPAVGAPEWVSDGVVRYSYLVAGCGYCMVEVVRYTVAMLRELHDSIRDDKYLVGKRLYNFSDGVEAAERREGGVDGGLPAE